MDEPKLIYCRHEPVLAVESQSGWRDWPDTRPGEDGISASLQRESPCESTACFLRVWAFEQQKDLTRHTDSKMTMNGYGSAMPEAMREAKRAVVRGVIQ